MLTGWAAGTLVLGLARRRLGGFTGDVLGAAGPVRNRRSRDGGPDLRATPPVEHMRLAVPNGASGAGAAGQTDMPARPEKEVIVGEGLFSTLVGTVRPPDEAAARAATGLQDRLTKPRGSLGRLEVLGAQLSAIARTCPPPIPEPVTIAIFAGDHGVVEAGVTPWPSEVTAQMVANFCAGGAAINVLARHTGATVVVVDVGVASPIPTNSATLVRRNVARGTANLARGPAMTEDQAEAALEVGAEIAVDAVAKGARMLVTGDMGIGNTTPSAALIAALTSTGPRSVTGRGTGIDDDMLSTKTRVIEVALARLAPGSGPLTVLAEVGGLEIAALAGFIVAGPTPGYR